MADASFPRLTSSQYSRRLIQGDLRDVSGRQPAATARRPCQQAQTHRDPAQPVFDPRAGHRASIHRDPGRRGVRLAHPHPGEEIGYIVTGTVETAIDGRATLTLQAGDGFLIPPGTPHNARDVGPGTGHMLSTYIVEAGQPLASFTGEPDDR